MGAICEDCKSDMHEVDGCIESKVLIGMKWYKRTTEHWCKEGERCHDCAAKYGEYHHFGCDIERCPKCGGQIISCDCIKVSLKFKTAKKRRNEQ